MPVTKPAPRPSFLPNFIFLTPLYFFRPAQGEVKKHPHTYPTFALSNTKAEAQAIVAAKGCLPIHTFAEWKKAGYSVKRGEHAAITCDLWKYTERPGKAAKAARAEAAKAGQNGPDADAPDPHYYMAKAHLFTREQVKPAGQDDAPKAKTPEEIAAYNKKLADERKARKAAQQAAAAPAPAQPAAECEQISMF